MRTLQLNADMVESFGPWVMGLDHEVMPYIDLANIFHASDPDMMHSTVRLAVEHGVKVGAHPAYPDLVGFGRRSLACSAAEIENLVLYQIGALAAICWAEGTELSYVKLHTSTAGPAKESWADKESFCANGSFRKSVIAKNGGFYACSEMSAMGQRTVGKAESFRNKMELGYALQGFSTFDCRPLGVGYSTIGQAARHRLRIVL